MTPTLAPPSKFEWISVAGEALLAALTTTYVFAVALLAVGLSLGPATSAAAAGVALAAAGGICLLRRPLGAAAIPFGIALVAMVLSVGVAAQVYDVSFDGQWYHQAAILALGRGWNPLTEPYLDILVSGNGTHFDSAEIWVQHYPKASWLIGAVIHQVTGSLQAAKGINLIAAAAAFGVVFGLAVRLGLGALAAAAVAGAAAANPVAVAQALTFYSDGLSASLLTILAAGLAALVWSNERRDLAVPALAIPTVVNLKFSVLVIAVVFCVAAGLIMLLRRGRGAVAAVGLLAALGTASVVLLGWAPYMQNLLDYGHPFYPLMGTDSVDIINGGNMPALLEQLGPIAQFAYGIFGETSTAFPGNVPQIGRPFFFSLQAARDAGWYDVRIGGFGVLFPTVALFAAITLAALLRPGALPKHGRTWVVIGLAVLGISVAIHPENWWARYVPQLWLIPVSLAALALAAQGATRLLGVVLLAAVLSDAAITAASAAHFARWRNREMIAEHKAIAQQASGSVEVSVGPFVGTWHRLIEKGFSAQLVANPSDLSCGQPQTLSGTYGKALYCAVPGKK